MTNKRNHYLLLTICFILLLLTGCSISDVDSTFDSISEKYKETKDNVTDFVESIPSSPSDFKTRKVDDNSVKIVKYKGDNQKVVIPSTINGKKVVEIEYFADEDDEIVKTVEIPSSVKIIGKDAFACMNALTTVTFSEGLVEIDEGAFGACINLCNINFPNTLKIIDKEAFAGTKLENIILPDSLEVLGYSSFALCDNLKSIDFGKGLLCIPETVCYSCEKLEFADLGNAETIMNDAFSGCTHLKKVKMLQGMERYLEIFPKGKKTKIDYYDKKVKQEVPLNEDDEPEEEYDDSAEKDLLW